MQDYAPVDSIDIEWDVQEDRALAKVDVTCQVNKESNSYHIYTLGPNDALDWEALTGRSDDNYLRFDLLKRVFPTSTPLSAGTALTGSTLVDSDSEPASPASPALKATGSWSKSPEFESRYSRGLWNSSYCDDMDTSLAHLRNTATFKPSRNRSRSPVKYFSYREPKHQQQLNNSNEQGSIADVFVNEMGSLEKVGQLEIVRGVLGSMLVLHIGRLPLDTQIQLQFAFEFDATFNKTNTFLKTPFDPVFWTSLVTQALPIFTNLVVIRLLTDETEYNLLVEMASGFAAKSIADYETVFELTTESLSRIPLKRTIELQLSRALALKEVSLNASSTNTVIRMYTKEGKHRARVSMEFDAHLPLVDSFDGMIMMAYLYVWDGPCPGQVVELRKNRRFVAECATQLNNDETQSAVKLCLPYTGPDTFKGLELVFEKPIAPSVAAVYTPCILDTDSYPVSLYDSIGCTVLENGWVKDNNQELYQMPADKSMVLLLLPGDTKFEEAKVRDISYQLAYQPVDDHTATVRLDMYVVVDINDAEIGRGLVQVHGTSFWGHTPSGVYVDGKPAPLGEYYCAKQQQQQQQQKTTVINIYKRQQSAKRDLEVKISWTQELVRRAKYALNDQIPYIAQQVENVRLRVDQPDLHGLVTTGSTSVELKNKQTTIRISAGEPIFVKLWGATAPIPAINENEEVPEPVSEPARTRYLWAVFAVLVAMVVYTHQSEISYFLHNCRTNDLEWEFERVERHYHAMKRARQQGGL